MKQEDDKQAPALSEAEQAKADRAIKIIYGVMAFFIVLPFIVFWIKKS